jgi:ADP-ribose pyrophosphatase YjhB (NUDIX family)
MILKEKLGVACVLIDFNTKHIYLSQRKGSYENGKYACPGGMVEEIDKSLTDAIRREVKEETDLDIDLDRFIPSIQSKHIGGKSDYTIWYKLKLKDGEIPKQMEPNKHGPWNLYNVTEATQLLPLMVSTKEVLKFL